MIDTLSRLRESGLSSRNNICLKPKGYMLVRSSEVGAGWKVFKLGSHGMAGTLSSQGGKQEKKLES